MSQPKSALPHDKPASASRDATGKGRPVPFSETRVWDVLRECFDPEIPLNIVDLGLVHAVSVVPQKKGKHSVVVEMTLTAPGCAMGPAIVNDAKVKIEALPEVADADVRLVWEPAWKPENISPDGRKQLGLE
ncbi:MAG: iron-sulfur cluster assembly protein [Puniceicoccales bacterium]|jgi:metal-sulfur cluster biosynthetic enzyme|nr:iron-sulfur cluster assembly protein [Puniceicoccales bacterium]